jgi:Glycosyl hydrolase family 10
LKSPIFKGAITTVLLAALAPCVTFGQVGSAMTNVPLATKAPIPPDYFGIVIAGIAAKQSWPRVPARSVRVFDSTWNSLELSQGKFDFRLLDQIVATAQEHHADLDLILGFPPAWASARPTETASGSRAEPANLADWETYVRTVAIRYRGRVHTYEIWNEPNTKASYTGDVPTLVKVCASAYRTLKQIDPTITVISPSPAPVNAFPFLRQFLTAGGGDTFDVLGYHFYDNLGRPQINPEQFFGVADHTRTLLAVFHLQSKPIWDTESGYYIQSSSKASHQITRFPSGVRAISQDEGVAAVGRSFIEAWAAGVTRLYWYAWAEPQYALADDMGATDKAATVAYRNITQWLVGSSFTSLTKSTDGLWLLSLTQHDGHAAWITWSSAQDIKLSLTADIRASKVLQLDGSEAPLKSGDLVVTKLPVLLK